MNRHIIFAVLLFAGLNASAQNFNPQVEVTNSYQSRLVESFKNDLEMDVPDSLLHFDYNFDYSVFENPFKGSYEFSPYLINMKPEPRAYDGRKFYLRAGAGYSLHPELEVVYAPVTKEKFRFNVYDNFKGYYGPYHDIFGYKLSDGGYLLDDYLGHSLNGYDFHNRLGASGIYESGNFAMTFDVGHRLIATTDTTYTHLFQAVDLSLKLGSRAANDNGMSYGLSADAVIGQDHISYSDVLFSVGDIEFDVQGNIAKEFGRTQRLELIASMDMAKYGGIFNSSVFDLYALPRYVLNGHRFKFAGGIKLSNIVSSDFTKSVSGLMHTKKSKLIYPDVSISYLLPGDFLTVYANATGGNDINSYSSILERSHFYNPVSQKLFTSMSIVGLLPAMDNSVTDYDVFAGIRGQIGQMLQFNLGAGYACLENELLDAVSFSSNQNPTRLTYMTIYEDMTKFYADADAQFTSRNFDFCGHFRYTDIELGNSNLLSSSYAVVPAKFKAEFVARYNWSGRVFFGVQGEYQSERGTFCIVPQFFDLGAFAEFRVNDRLSIWLSGDNFLNQTIQRTLIHAEKGLYGSVGICLTL